MTQSDVVTKLRASGVMVTPRMILDAIANYKIPRPAKNGSGQYDYTDEHVQSLDELYRRQPKAEENA